MSEWKDGKRLKVTMEASGSDGKLYQRVTVDQHCEDSTAQIDMQQALTKAVADAFFVFGNDHKNK